VVNLVTYRSELLAVCAVAAALNLRMRSEEDGWRQRLGLGLLYAVGLLAKESAAVLPALLIAQDLAQGKKPRDHLAFYAGLAALAAGWLALRSALVVETPLPYLAALPGPVKVWTSLAIQSIHARLLLWPWPLVPFYDWTLCPPALTLADPRALAGLFALVVPAALAWKLRRTAPAVALGLTWWLLGLVPTSQLLPLPVGAAERFVYLPSVGAALALAGLGQWLRRQPLWLQAKLPERRTVLAVTAAIAVLLAGLSVRRSLDWRDDLTLMTRATEDFPESFNAWHRLGQLHAQARRWPQAVAAFERADQALPDFEPNQEALAQARRNMTAKP
jgi:tetratricopeptide (TPR) repeat protein